MSSQSLSYSESMMFQMEMSDNSQDDGTLLQGMHRDLKKHKRTAQKLQALLESRVREFANAKAGERHGAESDKAMHDTLQEVRRLCSSTVRRAESLMAKLWSQKKHKVREAFVQDREGLENSWRELEKEYEETQAESVAIRLQSTPPAEEAAGSQSVEHKKGKEEEEELRSLKEGISVLRNKIQKKKREIQEEKKLSTKEALSPLVLEQKRLSDENQALAKELRDLLKIRRGSADASAELSALKKEGLNLKSSILQAKEEIQKYELNAGAADALRAENAALAEEHQSLKKELQDLQEALKEEDTELRGLKRERFALRNAIYKTSQDIGEGAQKHQDIKSAFESVKLENDNYANECEALSGELKSFQEAKKETEVRFNGLAKESIALRNGICILRQEIQKEKQLQKETLAAISALEVEKESLTSERETLTNEFKDLQVVLKNEMQSELYRLRDEKLFLRRNILKAKNKIMQLEELHEETKAETKALMVEKGKLVDKYHALKREYHHLRTSKRAESEAEIYAVREENLILEQRIRKVKLDTQRELQSHDDREAACFGLRLEKSKLADEYRVLTNELQFVKTVKKTRAEAELCSLREQGLTLESNIHRVKQEIQTQTHQVEETLATSVSLRLRNSKLADEFQALAKKQRYSPKKERGGKAGPVVKEERPTPKSSPRPPVLEGGAQREDSRTAFGEIHLVEIPPSAASPKPTEKLGDVSVKSEVDPTDRVSLDGQESDRVDDVVLPKGATGDSNDGRCSSRSRGAASLRDGRDSVRDKHRSAKDTPQNPARGGSSVGAGRGLANGGAADSKYDQMLEAYRRHSSAVSSSRGFVKNNKLPSMPTKHSSLLAATWDWASTVSTSSTGDTEDSECSLTAGKDRQGSPQAARGGAQNEGRPEPEQRDPGGTDRRKDLVASLLGRPSSRVASVPKDDGSPDAVRSKDRRREAPVATETSPRKPDAAAPPHHELLTSAQVDHSSDFCSASSGSRENSTYDLAPKIPSDKAPRAPWSESTEVQSLWQQSAGTEDTTLSELSLLADDDKIIWVTV